MKVLFTIKACTLSSSVTFVWFVGFWDVYRGALQCSPMMFILARKCLHRTLSTSIFWTSSINAYNADAGWPNLYTLLDLMKITNSWRNEIKIFVMRRYVYNIPNWRAQALGRGRGEEVAWSPIFAHCSSYITSIWFTLSKTYQKCNDLSIQLFSHAEPTQWFLGSISLWK